MKKTYIYVTMFFTGMTVMVIELLGTRIIAPVFGSGLYAWASLITVTLSALASGYFLGGWLADRKSSFGLFYNLILVSGMSSLMLNIVSNDILRSLLRFNVQTGALLSSFLLFFLPLMLLGMTSPMSIKLLTAEIGELGSVAGTTYAVSTAGSLTGTILTGFVLIPALKISTIFYLQFAALVVVWILHLFVFRTKGRILYSIIFIIIVFYSKNLIPVEGFVPGMQKLYCSGSFHGDLIVAEKDGRRTLYIDSIDQGAIYTATGLPAGIYSYYLETLAYFNPLAKKALLVGLGPGIIANRLKQYGIEVTCVEIEKKIVTIAKKYFNSESDATHVADGRNFMEKCREKYDYVIIDVFSGDIAPNHMLTKECFSKVKCLLNKGGLVGINLIAFPHGKYSGYWKSIYLTLNSVFNCVLPLSAAAKDPGFKEKSTANVILIASDVKPVFKNINVLKDKALYSKIKDCSTNILEAPSPAEGIIYTDDYCPVDRAQAEISRVLRKL